MVLPENFSLECNTNEDFLLYDFSVEQGEPIVQCILPSFYNAILDTIVNQEIHGVTTNIYHTSIMDFAYYEGIGSNFGLFEDMALPVKSTTELDYAQLYYY